MNTPESIAQFAGLLADRSRVTMCLALLDGRAWTASELGHQAGVARSTATGHLNLLVEAGVLAEERQGRHRYVRLANAEMAQLVEDLAAAVGRAEPPQSLRAVRASERLAAARTCYDHLAGRLGVALFDGLLDAGLVDVRDGLSLTAIGRTWFVELAGAAAIEARRSRPLLRTCLDWTERRPHLGGVLGAALCHEFGQRGWIVRVSEHRAVTLTLVGAQAIDDLLGVRLPAAQTSHIRVVG